jgi:hypothetical protein
MAGAASRADRACAISVTAPEATVSARRRSQACVAGHSGRPGRQRRDRAAFVAASGLPVPQMGLGRGRWRGVALPLAPVRTLLQAPGATMRPLFRFPLPSRFRTPVRSCRGRGLRVGLRLDGRDCERALRDGQCVTGQGQRAGSLANQAPADAPATSSSHTRASGGSAWSPAYRRCGAPGATHTPAAASAPPAGARLRRPLPPRAYAGYPHARGGRRAAASGWLFQRGG